MRAGARRALAAAMALAVLGGPAGAATTSATSRAAAAARDARTWRRAHERAILAELARFLALPNVASDRVGIERNADTLRAMLERRGLTVRVLRQEDAPPIVVADLAGPPDPPATGAPRTVAFYAHYDGQPTDTLSWRGLPWTPVLRSPSGQELRLGGSASLDPESRLYARSAPSSRSAARRAAAPGSTRRCSSRRSISAA